MQSETTSSAFTGRLGCGTRQLLAEQRARLVGQLGEARAAAMQRPLWPAWSAARARRRLQFLCKFAGTVEAALASILFNFVCASVFRYFSESIENFSGYL